MFFPERFKSDCFNSGLLLIGTVLMLAHVPRPAGADPARVGEPYQLLGKRLVFTNWIYVRPGDVGWKDQEGNSVFADESIKMGAFEAVWAPDDHMPWGIRIRARQPDSVEPYEFKDEDGNSIWLDTIVEDNGILKGWNGNFYFESVDGLVWKRPNLGLVEVNGSKENNRIPSEPQGAVFIDPTSIEERYKCLWVESGGYSMEQFEQYKERRPDGWSPRAIRRDFDPGVDVAKPSLHYLRGAVSPDGYHWTTLPDPIVVDHCDTENIGYYDPRRKKYVAYTRIWNALERSTNVPVEPDRWDYWLPNARRSIGRSESDDFRNFPLPVLIMEAGPDFPATDEFYTNCFTWVPGGPDQLLMFPAIRHLHDDTTTIGMASSANGLSFHWMPDGRELIPTGSFGQWDGGCVFASPPLFERGDGSFALRLSGHNFPHKYPRGYREVKGGLAVWEHGRVSAIEAPEKGQFATVAIVPQGKRLFMNADTRRTGSIRVAVQYGERGAEIIAGREFENSIPIVGDQPRALVRWKDAEDMGIGEGDPVILHFKLEQAKLYALEFE